MMDSNSNDDEKNHDTDRRDFLLKSIYTAYATPLSTALLVEEASAKNSIPNTIKDMYAMLVSITLHPHWSRSHYRF